MPGVPSRPRAAVPVRLALLAPAALAVALLAPFMAPLVAPFVASLAPPVLAAQMERLYEARAAVSGRDAAERERVLGELLLDVVRKVSGQRAPAGNEVIREASGHADDYVQQFRYQSELRTPPGASEPVQSFELWARFDPRAVTRLLGEAGLPVWGRIRPAPLVWLAVESGGARELVGADDVTGLAEVLALNAEQRGLPLILPLLDIEDRARLHVTDVWAGFRDTIREASRRYPTDIVLVGKVFQVLPTLWEGRWQLLVEGAAHEWTTRGDVVELAVEEAVHETADVLASRYARFPSETGPDRVALVVSGVRSVEDYGRALGYLESLELVTRVHVARVEDDRVRFELEARGGDDAVREVVALSRTLAPLDGPGGGADPLRYQLLP